MKSEKKLWKNFKMEEKIIEVEEKISLSNNMSFLSLILEASFFVQLIMLLLLIVLFAILLQML